MINKMEIANTYLKQFIGLMFRKEPQSMLFIFPRLKKVMIHTMFMRFPVDLYYFNENFIITRIVKNMGTWEIDTEYYCNGVLETPINYLNLKEGDRIEKDTDKLRLDKQVN